MSGVSVRPFESTDVSAAAQLLATRHAAHRVHFPELDEQFADPANAAAQIEEVLTRPEASGSVAIADGDLVAYVIGFSKPGASWGDNIWVESAGSACRDGEALRAAYAGAASVWVGDGRKAHYVLTPATDAESIDAWSRLAFGHQHAHALRSTDIVAVARPGVIVRKAKMPDIEALALLEPTLGEHQARSPVFSAAAPPTHEQALEDWREALEESEDVSITVVAIDDGKVVGAAYGCDLSQSSAHSGVARVPNAAFLGWAAVASESRGRGAGRALEQAVTQWAASQGYPVIVTDWRVTNLLSSTAWTAVGYRQTFLRMHRLVGY